jgi:hypothetical protein
VHARGAGCAFGEAAMSWRDTSLSSKSRLGMDLDDSSILLRNSSFGSVHEWPFQGDRLSGASGASDQHGHTNASTSHLRNQLKAAAPLSVPEHVIHVKQVRMAHGKRPSLFLCGRGVSPRLNFAIALAGATGLEASAARDRVPLSDGPTPESRSDCNFAQSRVYIECCHVRRLT